MKRIYFVLILFVLTESPAVASNSIYLVVKAGTSHYGSIYFGNLAGSGGDENWKLGPMISVGVGMQTSRSFAIEILLEYSTHLYDYHEWNNSPINDPRNTLFDITSFGRYSFLSFEFILFEINAGIGYSFQQKDKLIRVYQSSPTNIVPEDNRADISALLGGAINIKISNNIQLTIETNWRMRQYVTPVNEIGIIYIL